MGVRNVFTVELEDGSRVLSTIKGKVLPGLQGQYNSLAPGDVVDVEPDPHDPAKARVLSFEPRRSSFHRFNEKGMAPQTLAANADRVVLVATPAEPPFRPRFIDRVMTSCAAQGIPLVLVINKEDLGLSAEAKDRLRLYEDLGLQSLRVSAKTGKGLRDLRRLLSSGLSVLTGQSGVGKSSLLNALDPSLALKVGELCAKYGRGVHTTTLSVLLRPEGFRGLVVDTPGFRRITLHGNDPESLASLMTDLRAAAADCAFGPSCSHNSEEGCAVRAAAEAGAIHPDRYESYLRMREELSQASDRPLPRPRSRPDPVAKAGKGSARRALRRLEEEEE